MLSCSDRLEPLHLVVDFQLLEEGLHFGVNLTEGGEVLFSFYFYFVGELLLELGTFFGNILKLVLRTSQLLAEVGQLLFELFACFLPAETALLRLLFEFIELYLQCFELFLLFCEVLAQLLQLSVLLAASFQRRVLLSSLGALLLQDPVDLLGELLVLCLPH